MPAAKCVRAAAVKRDEVSKGVVVHLGAKLLAVQGRSGDSVALHLRMPAGEQKIDGSDILVAAGRIPIRSVSGSSWTPRHCRSQ